MNGQKTYLNRCQHPTVISETSKSKRFARREREDIYLVSGDSWEREFDENTDLPTTTISSEQPQKTTSIE